MKTRFLGTAGTVAGLLLCIGLAPNVYAQEAVLNLKAGGNAFAHGANEFSTFTLNQSLILNSVGFIAFNKNEWNNAQSKFYYSIGGSDFTQVSVGALSGTVDDTVRYFTFASPQSYAAGTTVRIRSTFEVYDIAREIIGTNSVGVSHINPNVNPIRASGNIRVSNPGSNVAPEPGSFALALTGGAALLGICVRRRRNAG